MANVHHFPSPDGYGEDPIDLHTCKRFRVSDPDEEDEFYWSMRHYDLALAPGPSHYVGRSMVQPRFCKFVG